MRRWLRKTLPPNRWLAPFVLAYLAGEAVYVCWFLITGAQPARDVHLFRDLALAGGAIGYGIFRAVGFHPLFNTEYRQWLERTPWTIAKPLPVGPIQLVPQDVLVPLCLFLLGQYQPHLDPNRLPLLFLLAYLTQLMPSYAAVGLKGYSYALAFGIGVVLRFWNNLPAATAIAACLYPLALAGLRQSLMKFPWDLPWFFDTKLLGERMQKGFRSEQVEKLGWPFGRLSPQPTELGIGPVDGTLLSLQAGWWLYVVASLKIEAGAGPFFVESVMMGTVGFCFWLAIARVGIYCGVHHPPINLAGRFFTLRWIIPGYDKVLVAPALSIAVPLALLGLLSFHSPLPPAVTAAIPLTAGLFVILNAGPTLKHWQLTGQHRLVPGFRKQTSVWQSTGQRPDDMIEI